MYFNEKEKNEERNRLYRLLYERDKEFEAAKLKRMIITIIGFSIAYFYLFFAISKVYGVITWYTIIFLTIASIIVSVFHFFINASIFGALAQKGRAESDILENIRKEISKLD